MTVKLCWWLCTISQFIFRYCRHCVILMPIHKNLKITKKKQNKKTSKSKLLNHVQCHFEIFVSFMFRFQTLKSQHKKVSEQLLTEDAEDVVMTPFNFLTVLKLLKVAKWIVVALDIWLLFSLSRFWRLSRSSRNVECLLNTNFYDSFCAKTLPKYVQIFRHFVPTFPI